MVYVSVCIYLCYVFVYIYMCFCRSLLVRTYFCIGSTQLSTLAGPVSQRSADQSLECHSKIGLVLNINHEQRFVGRVRWQLVLVFIIIQQPEDTWWNIVDSLSMVGGGCRTWTMGLLELIIDWHQTMRANRRSLSELDGAIYGWNLKPYKTMGSTWFKPRFSQQNPSSHPIHCEEGLCWVDKQDPKVPMWCWFPSRWAGLMDITDTTTRSKAIQTVEV